MRVNKAKRKLMKWERYDYRLKKLNGFHHKYYNGHAISYYNAVNAKRYVPIGVRQPYRAKWMT